MTAGLYSTLYIICNNLLVRTYHEHRSRQESVEFQRGAQTDPRPGHSPWGHSTGESAWRQTRAFEGSRLCWLGYAYDNTHIHEHPNMDGKGLVKKPVGSDRAFCTVQKFKNKGKSGDQGNRRRQTSEEDRRQTHTPRTLYEEIPRCFRG